MAAAPAIIIPTQATPPTDNGSNLFNLPWYLAFDAIVSQLNTFAQNAGTTTSGDNFVTINGIPVTY